MGCSNGGQQGLTAAQRYPEDYDGIVSGAPGTSFPDMSTYVMLERPSEWRFRGSGSTDAVKRWSSRSGAWWPLVTGTMESRTR